MFDTEWDAEAGAYYARQAATLDLIDERDVIGATPIVEPAPTDAELAAEAAEGRTGLSPAMVSHLQLLDLEELDATAAVDAAIAYDRLINQTDAQRMVAIATAVRRHRASDRVSAERAAAAELGPALGLGTGSIDRQISEALTLTGQLTATLARMRIGDVSRGKARVLVDETCDLSDEHARAVEAAVLPHAAGRTYAQHAAAVRRAVLRIDPASAERRRKANERTARLVRAYHGDGLASLVVTLPASQVDLAYAAADAWARARKAAGDKRPLDELRASAVARWASSYLAHGDSTTCDTACDPVAPVVDRAQTTEPDPEPTPPPADPPAPSPAPLPRHAPMRHGRPLRVGLVWDLRSLLELDNGPGELLDSGEPVAADDMRELLRNGISIRRMLIDPDTNELVDLTRESWTIAATDRTSRPHAQPMWIGVVVDTDTWQALQDGTADSLLSAAVTLAPKPVRDMLAAPRTADLLDGDPGAERPSAGLAEFVSLRDRHPANPTAGMSAAAAGDADHVRPRSAGGPTIRRNLHTPSRRWHVLRTHAGWRLRRHSDGGWIWRSPQGRTYRVHPYDYRRGP